MRPARPPAHRPRARAALFFSIAALAVACGGTRGDALPFTEARALCETLLPQVTGAFACRMNELQAPTRMGAEPRYDVEATAEFRPNGRLERFTDLRASGPASDPQLEPADCAARTLRRLQVPERADALTLPLRLQYRESEAIMAAASIQGDGRCTLTIPVATP